VTQPRDLRLELEKRVEAIEAGYEFMLAYAAQGLAQDAGSASGAQIREFLKRFDEALTNLAQTFRNIADGERGSSSAIDPFLEVLERDAQATQAAIRVVLAQPAISSQLVDNLNASIHVRALLTDVFLMDEAVKKAASTP
jgi:hypothetical protein